jgi:invasion protein IalB
LPAPAISDQAELPAPIYSPWTKFCTNETCFIGKDIRTECAPIFAAVLIENAKDAKKVLRVTVPTSVNTDRPARIVIDQAQPMTLPFGHCYATGCVADYASGGEIVNQIKQGRTLTIDVVDTANSPISLSLPLVGFAAAYDGPAQAPKVFEAQQGQLEKELSALHEPQKPTEDDPKSRCGAK